MNLKKIINSICIIFMLFLITLCRNSNSTCIHNNTKWNVEQEPTCQTAGKQSQICLDCNKILLSETIKKLDHDFEWIIDKEASTNEDGIKHQECTICHIKQNENTIIPMLDHIHSLIHVLRLDPTCTTDGNIEYYKCNICNKYFKDDTALISIDENEIIINASHNLIHHEGKDATCTTAGYEAYNTCKNCDYTTYKEIEALRNSFEKDECIRCHIQKDRLYKIEGNYIYFGEYPQTLKEDSVTIISDTPDSDGYYLGSDNNRYAKVKATPYNANTFFNNKTTIVEGTTYYFKVEPIKWQILEQSNGTYKLLSTLIIDNQMYCSDWNEFRIIDGKIVYHNNYKHSDIRNWLNNEFYNKAFIDDLKIYINTTLVDNSASTTGYTTNNYACENTNDKVYLLSYSDMVNTSYGFNSNTQREKQLTDYAKALGCYMDTDENYYNNGDFWLRSPDYDYDFVAQYVNYSGNFSVSSADGSHYVDDEDVGVAPAITITI